MRDCILWAGGILLTAIFFFLIIIYGPVDIPVSDSLRVLFGGNTDGRYLETIVMQTRLPMAIGAACCGAMLSIAGLMMQTIFHNPLAGPSVLGVSSGSSFGVALIMLGSGGVLANLPGIWGPIASFAGALTGGILTILILLIFSSILRSGVTLLIVGIMLSYLCSSGISLLNYFSPADEIRNYLVWGLGSFTGLRLSSSLILLWLTLAATLPAGIFTKPLNAMLMGERYMENVGYNVKRIRGIMLLYSGLLVAVSTAFCGPIGFIGLIVPHLCRLLFKTSNHLILLPASLMFGGLISLGCAFISIIPAQHYGIMPINVITPVIGVPVILYLLVRRNKIPYFS